MDICNNHLLGLIIFFAVMVAAIVSIINEEKDG